eukprot:gene20823-biopygen1061
MVQSMVRGLLCTGRRQKAARDPWYPGSPATDTMVVSAVPPGERPGCNLPRGRFGGGITSRGNGRHNHGRHVGTNTMAGPRIEKMEHTDMDTHGSHCGLCCGVVHCHRRTHNFDNGYQPPRGMRTGSGAGYYKKPLGPAAATGSNTPITWRAATTAPSLLSQPDVVLYLPGGSLREGGGNPAPPLTWC